MNKLIDRAAVGLLLVGAVSWICVILATFYAIWNATEADGIKWLWTIYLWTVINVVITGLGLYIIGERRIR